MELHIANPEDPDTAYLKKTDKTHGDYIANVVEVAVDNHNSITVDYQYKKTI